MTKYTPFHNIFFLALASCAFGDYVVSGADVDAAHLPISAYGLYVYITTASAGDPKGVAANMDEL